MPPSSSIPPIPPPSLPPCAASSPMTRSRTRCGSAASSASSTSRGIGRSGACVKSTMRCCADDSSGGRWAVGGGFLSRSHPVKHPDPSPTAHPPPPERVALVHDWLTGMRGGERVLEEICDLYPDAHLFTLVHVKGSVSPTIERHPIRTSWVQRLPRAGRLYRHYLPLHPLAVESFDLSGYDLVISSSHCVVKSVRKAPGATHVCYCHTPMRYAWDQFDAYFGPDQIGRAGSLAMRPAMAALARWDAATAHRPDRFLTNSQYVAGRIRRYYNRGSTVVYPPVDTEYFHPPVGAGPRDGSALVVSALVPYKRVEIAIEAARKASVRLRIAGQGPEERRLRRFAGDAPVEFLGWVPTEEIRRLYQTSSVTLLPGVEDFGIAPVEAHAC